LEEKFPVFQGKIAIAFHICFQKVQGLLRSKRPNLQETPVKQRSLILGEVKNYWCVWGGVMYQEFQITDLPPLYVASLGVFTAVQ